MAKKPKIKELLLKKGEKIGVIVALAGFIILLLVGVTSYTGAVNPVQQKQKAEQASTAVDVAIKNPATKAPALDPALLKPVNVFTKVSADVFPNHVAPFEPATRPSTLRDNPRVLSPIESQVNVVTGSYKGFDRQFIPGDNGEVSVRVGVLKVAAKSTFDWNKIQTIQPPKPKGKGAIRQQPMQPQPQPVQPPLGEGAPGPGMVGRPNTNGGERDDLVVQYMSLDEAKKANLPPARTIYPVRLGLIQMSLPLKEQLQEIRSALRLPNLAAAKLEASQATIDARAPKGVAGVPGVPVAPPAPPVMVGGMPGAAPTDAGDSPAYTGLIVERRVTGPDGQPSGWEAFDHQEKFFEKFSRYETPFVPDDGYGAYFLRAYQGLSAPLPVMAGVSLTSYPPDVTLPSIVANRQKLISEKVQLKTPEDLLKAFKPGVDNPYAPAPNANPGMVGGVAPPPGGVRAVAPEGAPGAAVAVDPNKLDAEYILLRFIDADMKPGYAYEYRVKVRMKNPNFNNPGKVANDSMATEETLESAWYDVGKKISVPGESYLYAYSAKQYEDDLKKLFDQPDKPATTPAGKPYIPDAIASILNRVFDLKEVQGGTKVVVQMQRWQEWMFLPGGSKQEPIGAWIQASMAVGPGEYIGRRTLVELPLWRSGVMDPKATKDSTDAYAGAYVLPAADAKTSMIAGWPADSGNRRYTLPRARILDFRTPNVLIDFDGGHVNTKVGTSTQTDDAAAELLILRDDGKIEVRREAVDMANTAPPTPRANREKLWDDWLTKVRKQSEPDALGAVPGTGGTPTPRGGTPAPR